MKCSIFLLVIKILDPHRAVLTVGLLLIGTITHPSLISMENGSTPTTKEIQEPREEITAGEN